MAAKHGHIRYRILRQSDVSRGWPKIIYVTLLKTNQQQKLEIRFYVYRNCYATNVLLTQEYTFVAYLSKMTSALLFYVCQKGSYAYEYPRQLAH